MPSASTRSWGKEARATLAEQFAHTFAEGAPLTPWRIGSNVPNPSRATAPPRAGRAWSAECPARQTLRRGGR
eukprot:12746621-Alexandrium_andersonii.AAC.1